MKFSTVQVCDAVGVPRDRVAQWIFRGKFEASHESTRGVPREWSPRDAYRLAVAAALADAGEASSFAGFLDVAVDSYVQDRKAPNFLVVHAIAMKHSKMWTADVVRAAALADFLTGKKTAIVLDLRAALGPAEEKLAKLL